MLRSMIRVTKNNEGATAIEFAMVAPALFLLIFGIIEFGLVMATQSALESSTSAAARSYKAAARSTGAAADTNAIHARISQNARGLVRPARLRVIARDVSWGGSSGAGAPAMTGGQTGRGQSSGNSGRTGSVIQYRVFYDYYTYTPFLASIFGGDRGVMVLAASTVVQNEPSIGGGSGV